MTDIALFHSSLGVRAGIIDAAQRLRADGHRVLVVDQYDGQLFDDYNQAARFVGQVGFAELMRRAVAAVQDLPDGFLVAGSPTAPAWPNTSPPSGRAAAC